MAIHVFVKHFVLFEYHIKDIITAYLIITYTMQQYHINL